MSNAGHWWLAASLLLCAGCSAAQTNDPLERSHDTPAGSSSAGSSSQPSAGASQGGSSEQPTAGSPNQSGGQATSGGSPGQAGSGSGGNPVEVEVPPGVTLPGQFLDLTNWYLTLPTGATGDPDDIFQPELESFTVDPYFKIVPAGVQFRAHAGGVTTSGSKYPRSELREMLNAGADKAAWGINDGKKHSMVLTTSITHLPVVKPDAVAAQIHDAQDDIVMVRLEGKELFVEGNSVNFGVLDPEYELGRKFTVKFEASGGHILVYFNDLTKHLLDIPSSAVGCYFKAGIYTHSNLEKGDTADAYGEAIISALTVTHE